VIFEYSIFQVRLCSDFNPNNGIAYVLHMQYHLPKTERGEDMPINREGPQRSEMIAVRLEPRLRYLVEVAASAKGLTLSAYVEWALQESFKSVTLRIPPEREPFYGNDLTSVTLPVKPNKEDERTANEAMSVANLADDLWSESEFSRLQNRSILAPHTLHTEDHALLQYLHSRDDLKVRKAQSAGYKLNREKIKNEWLGIRAAFAGQLDKKVKNK
jgi:hypothetical protein